MVEERVQRRLAAILAADVAGYSRLMGDDEVGTRTRFNAHLNELIEPAIANRRGRIVKTTGDGLLVEFGSVVDAVQCAVEIQKGIAERNADEPNDRRIEFRIGVNLGDVIIEGDDIHGDGVNVAARLQEIAEPGGIDISRRVYEDVQDRLEASFENAGEQELKNIARPVQVWRWSSAATEIAGAAGLQTSLQLPDKPSIAVLPFANISGDPEQEYFADGLVEDIITTLSKLAGLRVIARNSSFVYKGQSIDIREVAKQLGVQFVLEGSIRRGGDRIRITAQLIDASSGSHVWAERYDRAMDDIFAVQDEITLVLATEMQVKLTEGEQARLHYTTTGNVEAWTHWVKGLSHYRQAVTKENFTAAMSCWQMALALDPTSAALHGSIAYMHYMDARFGWWDDRQTALEKARTYSDRALELDSDNPDGHTASSLTFLLEGHYDEAAVHARRAAHLAPGSADAVAFACVVLANVGNPQEAVAHGERAMILSPNYPAYYLGQLGNAYRLAGRTEEAIAAFNSYHARSPGFGLGDLVIVYQQTDRPAEARRTAEQLLSLRRDFTIAAWAKTQFRADKAGIEADIAALRAAGLPMN
jgi:adenylate cyclase